MRLSISRVANLSAALVLLAIASAAASITIFLTSLGNGLQQQRTELAVRATTNRIETLLSQHREIARRLAVQAAEQGLLSDRNSAARESLTRQVTQSLPTLLRARLIPAGRHEIDASTIPELSYACLNLLGHSEKGEPGPGAELHLPNTPSAHIDVFAPVRGPGDNGVLLGHVLLSLKPEALREALVAIQAADGYAELHQQTDKSAPLAIATGGDSSLKAGQPATQRTIPGIPWQLSFWPAPSSVMPSLYELALSGIAALVALILFGLSAVLPRRALVDAVAHDAEIMLTFFSDIRSGVLMGQYPFRLREFGKLAKQLRSSGEAIIRDRQNLEKLAQVDALTGLASRATFEQKLEQLLQQARLGFSSALLITDIDHLKEINAQLGSEAVDLLLKQFAQKLRETLRLGDTIARLEGGTFGVLFPFTDIEKITPVVERLRQRMAEEFNPGSDTPRAYSWSAGLTLLSNTDSSIAAPTQRSEMALKSARREGGNRTVTHMP
jgi:diguanylate cyclase (GGDEF)-like protein